LVSFTLSATSFMALYADAISVQSKSGPRERNAQFLSPRVCVCVCKRDYKYLGYVHIPLSLQE
jgi:hypothetical protein